MATALTLTTTLQPAAAATFAVVPRGARFLGAFFHPGIRSVVLAWEAMNDVQADSRCFAVLPTGSPLPNGGQHLATVADTFAVDGMRLFHVYEISRPTHAVEVRPFAAGQAWAECSTCGWKSPLQHTEAAAEEQAETHRDQGAAQ